MAQSKIAGLGVLLLGFDKDKKEITRSSDSARLQEVRPTPIATLRSHCALHDSTNRYNQSQPMRGLALIVLESVRRWQPGTNDMAVCDQ